MLPLSVFAPLLAHSAGKTCPSDSPLSCHNSSAVTDTCCFIPAGQLLQTQFWDTDPPTGPSDSWTIHGLWPDNCDGSYPTACDSDRVYTNLSAVLKAAGARSTLDYMDRYWKAYRGDDDSLWEHEWAKHGTCVSTLSPRCYGDDYRPAEEAAAYFVRTVGLFKTLPTYRWLADAGIEPSRGRSYAHDDIQDALAARHGASVTLRCRGASIKEVWYHFNVRGSLQDGDFVAAEPDGPKSSCPYWLRYEPKEDDWARQRNASSEAVGEL